MTVAVFSDEAADTREVSTSASDYTQGYAKVSITSWEYDRLAAQDSRLSMSFVVLTYDY